MSLIKSQGRLMAIGGNEDKRGDCQILNEFVRLAGGSKAKIAVITAATETPEETAEEYIKIFKRCGAKNVWEVGVANRQDAFKPENVEVIKKSSGIFFSGGDQLHITSLMGGTDLQMSILESYKNGSIIAGTSAGAEMMGNTMIISGDSNENPRLGSVESAAGMDLIIGCIIDTHFSQRGRHGRLLAAIAHCPQDIGFGIDENTAMIIVKNKFKVIGEGAVTIIDSSAMTYNDVPFVERGQSIALSNVKIHVLPNSYQFDLNTRQMIIPKRSQSKAAAAGADENKSMKRKNH
jgi:cyanophycinase